MAAQLERVHPAQPAPFPGDVREVPNNPGSRELPDCHVDDVDVVRTHPINQTDPVGRYRLPYWRR